MVNTGSVQILTDSACDLPAEVVSRLGITVVPLLVRFGTEEFKDRVDLSIEEFWQRCAAADELPQTAAPSAAVFEQAFRDIAAGSGAGSSGGGETTSAGSEAGSSDGGAPAAGEPAQIVAVILSGALSATIEAARRGAQDVADAAAVKVIDSRNVSISQGLLVMLAAEMAQAGATVTEIELAVTAAVERTHLVAVLDTLENLRKGGRIGAAQSLLGSVLSIKPLIKIADGEVKPDGKQRSRAKALAHLHKLVAAQGNDIEQLAVIHAEAKDVGDFVAQLAPLVDSEILVSDVGPVVSVHSGIGAIGVAFRKRQNTDQVIANDERN